MPIFKTRVVLHKVSDHSKKAYTDLHAAMEKKGFDRIVTGENGKKYHLPPATYHYGGELTRQAVRKLAEEAAESLGYEAWTESSSATAKTYGVLVTEGGSSWNGLKTE